MMPNSNRKEHIINFSIHQIVGKTWVIRSNAEYLMDKLESYDDKELIEIGKSILDQSEALIMYTKSLRNAMTEEVESEL